MYIVTSNNETEINTKERIKEIYSVAKKYYLGKLLKASKHKTMEHTKKIYILPV